MVCTAAVNWEHRLRPGSVRNRAMTDCVPGRRHVIIGSNDDMSGYGKSQRSQSRR
jgi:hypothetical protein